MKYGVLHKKIAGFFKISEWVFYNIRKLQKKANLIFINIFQRDEKNYPIKTQNISKINYSQV